MKLKTEEKEEKINEAKADSLKKLIKLIGRESG